MSISNILLKLTMFSSLYATTVSITSHRNGPLPWARRFLRDIGEEHRHTAVKAGDRVAVASDMGNATVLEEIEMGDPPAFDRMDEFIERVAAGTPLKRSREIYEAEGDDPMYMEPVSSLYIDRAAENVTRNPVKVHWRPNPLLPRRGIMDYSADRARNLLGFLHADLFLLLHLLIVPAWFRTASGYLFSGQEILVLGLRRLKSVITFQELKYEFNRRPSHLCEAFNSFCDWLDATWTHLIDSSQPGGNLSRWSTQLSTW